MMKLLACSLSVILVTLSAFAQSNAKLPMFRDPDLPIAERVDDLLSRLTIEEKIGQTMMASEEIPRLGIPRYDWWNEALHGVARNDIATVFPQAIALAATWNPILH
jgi:beta-glucosidase